MSHPQKPTKATKAKLKIRRSIRWRDVWKEMPDDDLTVLVALDDGEVWTGFRDAGQWRYVSADLISARVTHWAEFPLPPSCPSLPSVQ